MHSDASEDTVKRTHPEFSQDLRIASITLLKCSHMHAWLYRLLETKQNESPCKEALLSMEHFLDKSFASLNLIDRLDLICFTQEQLKKDEACYREYFTSVIDKLKCQLLPPRQNLSEATINPLTSLGIKI